MEGGIDVTLKASEGVGLGEAGRASVKSLPLDFQRPSKLSHAFCEMLACLLMRSKVLDFSSQCGVVLIEKGPVDASCQFKIWVKE